jgi:REP element-mobilizing transposase RayT/retron-type reverse transcriptase
MKRQRIRLSDIADWDNLALAVWKAARGKHHRPDVICFTQHLDANLGKLANAILQAEAPYARYREFHIHDPKERLIHAACFEDRVLHHAIMNLAEPVFERTLVPTTYACRPDKGVHRAIAQVQANLRRYPWYVKVDISGYFPNIDHHTLFRLLGERFKGDDFLYLLWRIIDSYHAQPGKGLPIGSLTSQHFANYYLNGADRFLLEHLKVKAQVRYMDDTLFWCNSREEAKEKLAALREYLRIERQLQIKPDSQINRCSAGVTYCGYRILPGAILLSRRKRQRYQQLRQQADVFFRRGAIHRALSVPSHMTLEGVMNHAPTSDVLLVLFCSPLPSVFFWSGSDMTYNPDIHHRRSVRLCCYDYAQAGAYFVTVCTHNRECLFGTVVDEDMVLSAEGKIIQTIWGRLPEYYPGITLDAFVAMPNHIHGIIMLNDYGKAGIGEIVRGFKARCSYAINKARDSQGIPFWQRNYYEHIVRDEYDLARIRKYIETNPANWINDTENPHVGA